MKHFLDRKRYRMMAVLLGMTAAVSLQPMAAWAGPATDGVHSSTMNGGGPGSSGAGSTSSGSSSGSSGSTSSGTAGLSLPLRPAQGYGVAAVLGGLGAFRSTGEEAAGAIARGIDVSYWNQNIDWKQVAEDNVQFVMLATRFRGMEDPFFSANADAASKAGLRLGAYIYSYATSKAMAEEEADFVLKLIKDYPISFPVVFDAENAETLGTLSPSEVSDVINAFCRKVEAAGYYPMVYANEYWINNKIDMSKLKYDIWVAKYNERYTYASPAMWQASNTGSVNGVSGNVDIDYLYKDYTQVIPGSLWRNIGGSWYYYKDHALQRDTWIHDGRNWYYMTNNGTPTYGWLNQNGKAYYLEPGDGRMVTGWKQLDSSWYFFDPSGEMASGWRNVGGVWYYMGNDGKMLTGWQEINGSKYLLDGSGAMITGWRDDGAGLYYLDVNTGALAVNTELEQNGVRYRAGADGICTEIPEALPEVMPEGADGSAIQNTGLTGAAVQAPSGPAGQ